MLCRLLTRLGYRGKPYALILGDQVRWFLRMWRLCLDLIMLIIAKSSLLLLIFISWNCFAASIFLVFNIWSFQKGCLHIRVKLDQVSFLVREVTSEALPLEQSDGFLLLKLLIFSNKALKSALTELVAKCGKLQDCEQHSNLEWHGSLILSPCLLIVLQFQTLVDQRLGHLLLLLLDLIDTVFALQLEFFDLLF